LGSAEVVDLSLDLDHEEPARSRMERQDVDPARAEAAPDLDFGLDKPPRASQPSGDMGNAAGMDAIALREPVDQERGLNRELHAPP
jgi:hypothetical protein